MADYVCTNCGKEHATLTPDKWCPLDDCFGIGVLVEKGDVATAIEFDEIGLCVLVCDCSGSMDSDAEGLGVSRLKLVATNAAAGIADLFSGSSAAGLSKASSAYIAVVQFSDDATMLKLPNGDDFVLTVADIQQQFKDKATLAAFFEDALAKGISRGTTNISAGLALAKQLCLNAAAGALAPSSPTPVRLIQQDVFTHDHRQLAVPNCRVLLYSDGEHNCGSLVNAFAPAEIAHAGAAIDPVLLTVFFGTGPQAAIQQLEGLSGICPKHNVRNFFLMNSVSRYAKLRGLFRMASGASGFCATCLAAAIDHVTAS